MHYSHDRGYNAYEGVLWGWGREGLLGISRLEKSPLSGMMLVLP